jgi:hypothetical protein
MESEHRAARQTAAAYVGDTGATSIWRVRTERAQPPAVGGSRETADKETVAKGHEARGVRGLWPR